MRTHARVVVIGGGIVGCQLLYNLTKLGWSDVVLIERDELTSGSTWHAAGLCHYYGDTAFLTRLPKESFEGYQALEKETGASCGIHVCGGLRLTRDPDGIAEYKRYLGYARAMGIDAEIVSPVEARRLFPLLERDDFEGALYTPQEGYVDPTMTTNAFAHAARGLGAVIYRHTSVVGLAQSPSGEWIVETDKGPITCEVVVNCGGSWGNRISALLGKELPLATLEHQYLVTEQGTILDSLGGELPVLRYPSIPCYVRQERQGLMVSAFEHTTPFQWLDGAPDGFSMELFPPDLERSMDLLDITMDMIPALQGLGIQAVFNGPIPATPDMLGLVGPAHGFRNYFACCGIHGGFVHGGLTRYLAEWVVEGEPSIDMSSFDPRRFDGYCDRDYTVARITELHLMYSVSAFYAETELQDTRNIRVPPLYQKLSEKRAVFGTVNGWEVPNWFAPVGVEPVDYPSFDRANWFQHVGNECRLVRKAAGVFDCASNAKFLVKGSSAATVLDQLSCTRLPARDASTWALFLTQSGGIEVTCRIYRLDEDEFFVSAPSEVEQRFAGALGRFADGSELTVENLTKTRAMLLIAGPSAAEILESVAERSLNDFVANQTVDVMIAGKFARLAKVDDIDAVAWEIHMEAGDQVAIYEALFIAGSKSGLIDFGQRAWKSLRTERGIARSGYELSIEVSPMSVGLGGLVDQEKADFIGKAAFASGANSRSGHALVLMHVCDPDLPTDPWGGEVVEVDGRPIGAVTSGSYGHTVEKSLAFALVQPEFADAGTALQVRLFNKSYDAVVCDPPL